MVLINNKNFEVYNLDNVDSILNRIAANFNTIKKFLYFPDGIPTIKDFNQKTKNIVVEDILNIISNDRTNNFEVLFNSIKDKLEQQNIT